MMQFIISYHIISHRILSYHVIPSYSYIYTVHLNAFKSTPHSHSFLISHLRTPTNHPPSMETDWSREISRLNLATALSSIGRISRGFHAELGEAMPFTTAPQRWLSFARASLRWSDLLGGLKGGFTAGSDLER